MGYSTYTCPIATECGGCEWLSVPYPIQLRRKREMLEELFSDLGMPVDEVRGMDVPLEYRAKVMTPFVKGSRGHIRFGMYRKGTHEIVETSSCLVEYPAGRPILASIAELAERFGIEPYDEDRGSGLLRHAIIRFAHATDEIMVTLVINRKDFPHKKAFIQELRDRHPRIATVVFNVNTRKTNAVLGPHSMTAFGQGWIEDEVCGCRFRIPSQAFYQTNPVQTEVLYSLAVNLAEIGRGSCILDAYCGIGTIGIIAAKASGARLIGVESVADAVRVARENARLNKVADAEFFAADAGEFLRGCEGSPDVVFMDPPRAGASEEFMATLRALKPRRIVYISCNPVTQVRDIALLGEDYRVDRIVPVDMFPHTKHVECVVSLSRAQNEVSRKTKIGAAI